MKKIISFILIIISVISLWAFSLNYTINLYGPPNNLNQFNNVFSGINSLFICLSLAAIVFAITVLVFDTKKNAGDIENIIQTNNNHLQILALSTLIQEADATLHRYDRWEEAGIKGDYMNAKASERDKMNTYREALDTIYQQLQES
ncbi:MAG: hypothetical protein QM504_02955 [Pseudomonadota bacterium]